MLTFFAPTCEMAASLAASCTCSLSRLDSVSEVPVRQQSGGCKELCRNDMSYLDLTVYLGRRWLH